jgi:GNAT superfamily N-acetyltransferase
MGAALASQFRIAEVDGVEEEDTLKELQLACLPPDVLYPTDSGCWWLATIEDEVPVAFAGLTVYDEVVGYLCRVGVLPEFRGNRLQARLTRAVERRARRIGCTLMVTDTNRNPPSENSLIRCGFRLFEPEYPPGKQPAWAPWALPTSIYWRKPLF